MPGRHPPPSNPRRRPRARSARQRERHTCVNDEWRRWIAENLMIGQSPESLLEAMTASGFSHEESASEINAAVRQPLPQGLGTVAQSAQKRDWLLAVYRKSNRLHPTSAEIEHRHKLSRDEFLREYYSTNRPVIITGMMDDWPAMRKWNLDYFERTIRRSRGRGADGPDGRRELRNRAGEIYPQDPIRRFCREGANRRPRRTTSTLPPTIIPPTGRSCPSYGTISCRSPNISTADQPAASSGWAPPARSRRSIMT